MITQEVVNENLGHALENGQFTDLSDGLWSVAEIVADLQLYSVDCEEATEDLTPLVQVWYDARRKMERPHGSS